jgi:hypothetical protein
VLMRGEGSWVAKVTTLERSLSWHILLVRHNVGLRQV